MEITVHAPIYQRKPQKSGRQGPASNLRHQAKLNRAQKTPFEKLQELYPNDPDLIIKFNGSCRTIQELYNGAKTPKNSDVNFYKIMKIVLAHCSTTNTTEKTLRRAILNHFVHLFDAYKDQTQWVDGQLKEIERLIGKERSQMQTGVIGFLSLLKKEWIEKLCGRFLDVVSFF